jgi:hypothetical protein
MAFKLDAFGLGYYPDDLALRYYDKAVAVQEFQEQSLRYLRQRVLRRAALAAGEERLEPGEEGQDQQEETEGEGEGGEKAEADAAHPYVPRKRVKSKRGKTASWFGAE